MKYNFIVLLALCFFISACSAYDGEKNSADLNVSETLHGNNEPGKTPEFTALDSAGPTASAIVYNGTNPTYDWDKKIIKTANVQVTCQDYTSYNQQVHAVAKQHGGWISSEAEIQHPDRISNSISIKVPVPQFEDAVAALEKLDANILEKRITTDDVTGKIVDANGRIAVRKEMRDKYLEMLHHTSKIEDALKVQQEINNIHESIEMAATHVAALQHQASYSTILLNYYQPLNLEAAGNNDNAAGFGKRIWLAAANGGSWMLDILVGLVSVWPLLLLSFIAVVVFRRRKFFTRKALK